MEALPCVSHQFCHAAGVEDERTHHLVQFCEELFLLLGKLLRLVPNLSGVEEVGGDLDVAGSHLMDTLRYGYRRAGAASAAYCRVAASRAW